jgi:hypothetical protein
LDRLEQLGKDSLSAISDLLDDRTYEALLEAGWSTQVRHRFLHGDCDVFAAALHLVTGWSVVTLVGSTGPVHRLVEAPDGRLLDAGGWTDLDALRHRYRLRSIRIGVRGGLELCDLCFPVDDLADGSLSDALLAASSLPWAPFNTGEWNECLALAVGENSFAAARPRPRG